MQIQQAASPNHTKGRKGKPIKGLVLHITAGLMPGCLSWMRNPQAKASAHYLVTKAGRIYQMVQDADTSWHAGIVNKPQWASYPGGNPNHYTLGIEFEALGGETLTEVQYQAGLELIKMLVQKYGIPVDREHIIGHYRIDSVNRPNDPGPGFPWDRLFKDLLAPAYFPVLIRLFGSITIEGVIIDDVSCAPVRDLVESLGRQVQWMGSLNSVFIPPVTIAVQPSLPGMLQIVTGNKIIHGRLVGDKAYAPVREVAEMLGFKVGWDNATRTVLIN